MVRAKGEFEQGLVALYSDSIVTDYQGELAKLKQKGYKYDEYKKGVHKALPHGTRTIRILSHQLLH